MNLLITMREEILCLIILVFLFLTSQLYKIGKENRSFFKICSFAIGHIVFDLITVFWVNHLTVIPHSINWFAHVLFYLFALLFTRELLLYVVKLVSLDEKERQVQKISLGIIIVYCFALPFLPMDFLKGNGTMYSYGMAAFVGYAVALLFLLFAILLLAKHYHNLNTHIRRTLVPSLIIAVVAEIIQIMVPELLFTGASVTILTIGVFFGLENPATFFQTKAILDALTGVKNRNVYEYDFAALKNDYEEGKYDDRPIGLVFCDLNGLKKVNDLYGHMKGDEYIGTVAQILTEQMLLSRDIYRMGGDEFLVVYIGVSREKIEKEIDHVKKACQDISYQYSFPIEVAMGFAISGAEYSSLKEVLQQADHNMYQNKWKMKNEILLSQKTDNYAHFSDQLDKSGLDTRVFDAFASTSDHSYIYLCNMRTNVSRWSKNAVDYFGLPGEYMLDAGTIWEGFIHPEDREAYKKDIQLVFSGKKDKHNVEYRAKNKEGKYVVCTCQGTILKGENGDVDLFAGTLFNHGIIDGIDPVTGLHNQREYSHLLEKIFENKSTASILLIGINNFGRVNVVYGNNFGNEVLRLFALQLRKQIGVQGRVFRMDGAKFAICLQNGSKEKLEDIYNEAKHIGKKGIYLENIPVPLTLSAGGAVIDNLNVNEQWIRNGVEYALSQSKHENHGVLTFWGEGVQGYDEKRLELYYELSQSIINHCDGYFINYQPLIDTQNEQIIGVEALLRWKNEDFGVVSPGCFIEWLEMDPSFIDLGWWIIRQVIQDMKPWVDKDPQFIVNINITAKQISHPEFHRTLVSLLDEYDFPHQSLCLELTERCRSLDYTILKDKLDYLNEQNILVAMDDMGTGSASLSLVLELPIDIVKIDMSLIKNISHKHANQLFVSSIIETTNKLSIKSCLEGVEYDTDYEYLKNIHASYYQGYYFSKPVSLKELLLIDKWRKDGMSFSQIKKMIETKDQ